MGDNLTATTATILDRGKSNDALFGETETTLFLGGAATISWCSARPSAAAAPATIRSTGTRV